MTYRITSVAKNGLEVFVVGLYVEGRLYRYTTTMGAAGARNWLLLQGVAL